MQADIFHWVIQSGCHVWQLQITADFEMALFLFTAGVINVLLRQLAVKQQGNYVSPRVVQGIFSYFIEA